LIILKRIEGELELFLQNIDHFRAVRNEKNMSQETSTKLYVTHHLVSHVFCPDKFQNRKLLCGTRDSHPSCKCD